MASLKKAIEAKCKDCTYDSAVGGTWREQVEMCTVKKCPLWEVRPVTVHTINLNRNKRNDDGVDIDALIAGLPDDEEETAAVA